MKSRTYFLLFISFLATKVTAEQISNPTNVVRTCSPNYNGQVFSYVVIDYHSWLGSCVYTTASYNIGRSNPYRGPWETDQHRNYWRCWSNADLCTWMPL